MSGFVFWLIVAVFFVSLNRVFGALGRNMTGEDGSEAGRPPGPGGDRPGQRSVGSELLREISQMAEREARARAEGAEGRSGSQMRWRPGLGGGDAPLGTAPSREAPPERLRAERTFGSGRQVAEPGRGGGVSAPAGAGSRVPGRTSGGGVGAPVGAGSREIGSGPLGSSTPGPARAAGAAGTGLAAVTGSAGSAARLPAWPERTALQRAVLYGAILGPPLALRGEAEGPWGGPPAA
jgi:hypothetical protein